MTKLTLNILIVTFTGWALSSCGVVCAGQVEKMTTRAALPEKIDFDLHIRPLIADRCFKCHGPDENARKSDLRLDTPQGAFAKLSDHYAIVPGKPLESELYRRITASDPDEKMPKSGSGLSLFDYEIQMIRRWIEQGAEWKTHWSFTKPENPTLPKVSDPDWPRNPIDTFILHRLDAKGLKPSPEADPETLIRRLSLDLTGLPPSPSQIDDFLNDKSSNAYETLVDRLLASPSYGERMALPWLDAARYADTSGYQADWERTQWPWRDWVIGAYNRNTPFDTFTIEQLAGDMLPNATFQQKTASGFNRNHRINDEGGAIAAEYIVEYVVDRVNTTSAVWLGITMECARCHSHKYDPITQKEYYQFFAFFHNIPEKGKDGRQGWAEPVIELFTDEQKAELNPLREKLEGLNAQYNRNDTDFEAAQHQWESAQLDTDIPPAPKLDPWYAVGPFEGPEKDQVFDQAYPPEKMIDLEKPVNKLKWTKKPKWTDGKVRALNLPDNAAIYLYRTIHTTQAMPIEFSLGSDDAIKLWLNEKEVLANNVGRGVKPDQEKVTAHLHKGENHLLMKIINGGGASGFYFKMINTGLPPHIIKILKTLADDRSPKQQKALTAFYRSIAPQLDTLRKEIADHQAQLDTLKKASVKIMVMEEMQTPRDTYLLKRGQYDQPDTDQKVTPGTPVVLGAMSETLPRNRLGLAQWLVHPDHPLTARVAVNRYWQMVFGTGLVKTIENFGTQGERPSHPKLLDWLATEFIRSGWNVKAMQKLIVTSATYRQSSKHTADLLKIDPQNRLLARGPRFRLSAHAIRDQALAAGGLLVQKIGGPSVKPYQPGDLWAEVSFQDKKRSTDFYVQDHGEKLYRKSIYTFMKRTVAPAMLNTFDASDREVCSLKRPGTNTPLQALNLMNDTTFVEAARAMAQRAMTETTPAPNQRIIYAYRLATAHEPSQHTLKILKEGFDYYLDSYRKDPGAATKLISVGESPYDHNLDPAQLAAYTMVASIILNLDETITKE